VSEQVNEPTDRFVAFNEALHEYTDACRHFYTLPTVTDDDREVLRNAALKILRIFHDEQVTNQISAISNVETKGMLCKAWDPLFGIALVFIGGGALIFILKAIQKVLALVESW